MTHRTDALLGDVPVHWDTFLDTPPEESDPSSAGVVVVPVPYDLTTSYSGGARHGPGAIISASRQLEDYDLELDRDISAVGIHTTPEVAPSAAGPKAMIERVAEAIRPAAEAEKLVALLGGEHTITTGAVQAMARVHPDLSVLYLDAHADLRDEYMGTRWGHASVARRIREACPMVLVGVRSLCDEELSFIRNLGLRDSGVGEPGLPVHYWSPERQSVPAIAEAVAGALTDRVYISLDLDVLDPSIMPAVGTPEPGGMTWDEVTGLLRIVAARRRIVGFDVTELSPAEGPEACAYTAAKLAYKIMGYATTGRKPF